MQSILDLVQKLGAQRLAAMGAVTLALVAFFGFLVFRMAQQPMALLFADLSPQESAAILRDLDARGVKYDLRQDGATIAVARDLIPRLRMDLAAKGMPAGGTVGYEIFDKGDGFSTTNFMQNLNQTRALEGELARSIRALDRVQSARVHLALPERKLFQKDRPEARASVVLRVRGELDAAQIRAIRHLVASAVDGLRPGRVSLIDEAGRLLADGAGDDAQAAGLVEERQQAVERRLRSQIEEIVASVVGRGRARVQVAAEFEQNRIQQTSETYDPESRVIRSTQSRTESNASTEGKDGQVTVANELPGASARDGGAAKEQGQKNEEMTNYEISRTTRTETLEAGRLKRLSVAVLVDGVYTKSGTGEAVYAARGADELTRIAALVRMGIGFDKARGDQVEVVNLRFAEAQTSPEVREPAFLERLTATAQENVLRLAEIAVFAILTLVVLIFVVRPLLRQMLTPAERGELAQAQSATATQQAGTAATQASSAPVAELPGPGAIERLGERIASQPQEAAAILKTWIRSAA